MTTYKNYVMTGSGGRWATNALTFATVEEATAYAHDLFGRWLAVTDWAIVEGDGTEMLDEAGLEARGIAARR